MNKWVRKLIWILKLIFESIFAITFPLLLALPFILALSLPAIFELIKPRDAGPKIVQDMTPPWNAWHKKIEDIEPYIPDLVTEKTRDCCDISFGIESLPNMEAFS